MKLYKNVSLVNMLEVNIFNNKKFVCGRVGELVFESWDEMVFIISFVVC